MRLIDEKQLNEHYFEEMPVSDVLEYLKQKLTIKDSKKIYNKKAVSVMYPEYVNEELNVIYLDKFFL